MSDGRQTPQIYNGGEVMWAPNNYPYPPPPAPPNPNYYYYPSPPPLPPQTPEQQQQFWDHYNAMCSYVAEMNNGYGYPPHYGYSPQLYTPPPQTVQYASDSDECGYSSTDEMNYYAAYFKKYPPPIQPYRMYYPDQRAQTPQIVITPSHSNGNNGYNSDFISDSEKETKNNNFTSCSPSVNGDSEETTTDDGSDTEVEEDNLDRPQGLQTIKSVPDISVYKDSSTSDIQSQNSETDEPDEETNEEEEEYVEDLPHQLSVIFEESEHSEVESLNKMKCRNFDGDTTSEGDSSTATLDNGDDTDDDIVDTESSTVLVRLPLKLKFSKTENNEDLTTVIVGDSEIESSPEAEVRPGDLIIQEVKRVDDDPDVSVTFTIPKKKTKTPEVITEISEAESKKEEPEKCSVPNGDYEVNDKSVSLSDSKEVICDKELSVVLNCDDANINNNTNEDRCKSESPIDFWKELSCDDLSTKSHVPADVSVSITLPPKSLTKSGSRSPLNNFTSESDDSRPEESDGHWEDDSSSTSVQTVRIGKHSGSDNFSGSEVENCGTADEVENINKVSPSFENRNTIDESVVLEEESKHLDDDHERIPIEDLLYDDSSSSEDDESVSSSSSSESSEESSAVSEPSKECKQNYVTSNVGNRADEKCDDDVFLSENSKNEASNHLTVEQKAKKTRGTSCKSQDESEEDDSGVTSDMSRHISETDTEPECGSELRKLTPYQRASTHSRLFKLLQDECSTENDEENLADNSACDGDSISSRKERLSLPLQTYSPSDPESMSSSSGINSPVSPTVNDRLVRELVQSLLTKKKGRHFRKLPMEKLYAAALRILQEDMDPYDTLSSTSDDSFQHSPISESTAPQTNTANNPASQTQEAYGGNYYDYCDYYNTWGNPYYYSDVEDSLGYDIIPSRAFKLLQERAQTPHGFSSGVIEGLVAKCPRVLSSKDIPKDSDEVLLPDSCPQASSSSET